MPWAGQDLALIDPFQLPVAGSRGRQRARDSSSAERAKLMQAHIRQRVELSIDIEDADLQLADRDNPALAKRDLADLSHNMFSWHSSALLQVEEPRRVAAHQLFFAFEREWQLQRLAWVIEIVVRPIRGEHDVVLAAKQPHERDQI